MPNSKKKLLGSARLRLPLLWLPPDETPQDHPSVAIIPVHFSGVLAAAHYHQTALPVAPSNPPNSPPHTLFAAFLIYNTENQYSYNKPNSRKSANKGSRTRPKRHFSPSFWQLNPTQPTKKNVKHCPPLGQKRVHLVLNRRSAHPRPVCCDAIATAPQKHLFRVSHQTH